MVEVLAPVGSPESLVAAVRSGADAVYLGAKSFSARRNATNFDDNELSETIKYCHLRNVKVYVTVNIMVKQSELDEAIKLVDYLYRIGVDGLIVQDLGIAKVIHDYYPDLPLHGSTQMSIHHPAVLPLLKQLNFKRIVVAREMSATQLRQFCQQAKQYDIEVEYFVHGALCMSVSGQCLVSAMIGSRSGNRGLCAQTCRLPFMVENGNGYDLSLKDLSLLKYVDQLEEMGVSSLKIEGRMKRAEYVALATYCTRMAVEKKEYDASLLADIFSRSGFTDGYYTGKTGKDNFGIRTQEDADASAAAFSKIHELYRNERQSVPLDLKMEIKKDQDMVLSWQDIKVVGEKPLPATGTPSNSDSIKQQLGKLGGTFYYLNECDVQIEEGLYVRNSTLNQMRRDLIELINQYREQQLERHSVNVENNFVNKQHSLKDYYLRVNSDEQIPDDLSAIKAVIVQIDSQYQADNVIVEIPRWIHDGKYISDKLDQFKARGVTKAFCNNLAAVQMALEKGFEVMGGNYLNVANSNSAALLQQLDVEDITVSAELSFKEIEQIETVKNKGIIGYGYLPLMLLRNCPLRNGRNCGECDHKGFITDRKGIKFPVRCRFTTSELFNSTPIYLADKLDDIKGIDYLILYCTIETKEEVTNIIEAYKQQTLVLPNYTRGLYYRSVL